VRDEASKSRFLSLVLRHKPELAGLVLDSGGWVSVADLLEGLAHAGRPMTRWELEEVVRANDKQRFAFSPDGASIRASQGHSVQVNLELEAVEPPPLLYHGTVERFLASIMSQGLLPRQRHHVHLSADRTTAVKVGSRRGKAVVLEVDSAQMARRGHAFFRSANGVWLTETVPPDCLWPAR
jgi:putative RNA 2'-phosphotransferase